MHAFVQTQTGRLMPEQEAAEHLGISVRTLQAWRVKGGGPKYSKIGRSVRYRLCDLDAFIEANLTNSTSESGAK